MGNRIPLGSSSAIGTSMRGCLWSRGQGAKEPTRGGEPPRDGGKLVLPLGLKESGEGMAYLELEG